MPCLLCGSGWRRVSRWRRCADEWRCRDGLWVVWSGEAGDDETTAFESTAVFQPVVQLQEVETKTHEEEEDALYKQ